MHFAPSSRSFHFISVAMLSLTATNFNHSSTQVEESLNFPFKANRQSTESHKICRHLNIAQDLHSLPPRRSFIRFLVIYLTRYCIKYEERSSFHSHQNRSYPTNSHLIIRLSIWLLYPPELMISTDIITLTITVIIACAIEWRTRVYNPSASECI